MGGGCNWGGEDVIICLWLEPDVGIPRIWWVLAGKAGGERTRHSSRSRAETCSSSRWEVSVSLLVSYRGKATQWCTLGALARPSLEGGASDEQKGKKKRMSLGGSRSLPLLRCAPKRKTSPLPSQPRRQALRQDSRHNGPCEPSPQKRQPIPHRLPQTAAALLLPNGSRSTTTACTCTCLYCA